jgi:putative peptidoglycan binding protein
MHQLLKITAAGLVVALAAGPAFAQGGANPKQEQQAPRNSSSGQSGPNQPSTTGTDSGSSGTTSASPQDSIKGGTIRGENMPRGTTRDSGKSDTGSTSSSGSTSGTMSRDNGTTGSSSGAMSSDSTGNHGRGMRGGKASASQVRQVQEALKAQGHDPGPIDGVMGPQTQDALRAYQRSQNLTETGRLDAQTSQKLGVSSGSQPGSSSSGSSSGSQR